MAVTVYTIPELIPVLRMKKRAIRKLIAEGELPARLVGRQWLVREEDLKMFLDPFLETPDSPPCGNCHALK
jgi:excisionase family DNA binding protein